MAMDYREARELLLARTAPLERTERAALEQSLGRVLAEDVVARGDVPPFDRSPYDGYAFRAADTRGAGPEAPVTLTILEEVPAGSMWSRPVTPGTATKILTGAPVPPGADAIVKYEDTRFDARQVTLFQEAVPGENIVPRGEDVRAGDLLVPRGTAVDAALMGCLASQGVTRPLVYARPRVGILTTGSELADPEEPLTGGRIVNSNRYTFQAVAAEAGCEPVFLGAPGDTVEAIAAALEDGFARCDAILTTGGVSVGDYDMTPAALDAAGVNTLIREVDLKPGGACAYGERAGKPVFCLSGNPASALTNFYAVALPALRRLRGLGRPHLEELRVRIKTDYPKRSPKTRLLRGRLDLSGGTAWMELAEAQGNGVLHTMIGCDVLAVVPAGSGRLAAGTELDAYRLN